MPIKEHHIKKNALMDFLQAHNCIFYSPLSQTDTTDWISGNAMVAYSANSVVWDSSLQMWKFQYVSGQPYGANQYYAKWDLKETIVQTQANITTAAQVNSDTASDCFYDFLPTRLGLSLLTYVNIGSESVQLFVTENNITKQKVYRNGNIELDYNYNQPYNFFNGETGVRIGCPINSSRATTFCMRNFAVFASGLTLTEINEYFNLI